MLRSAFCDYSDAYVIVKGKIIVEGDNDANIRNTNLIFKNNAPYRSCISKINNYLQTMEKILILLCRCIICQNMVTIIL